MKKDRENMTLEISHLTGGYSGIPVIKDVNLTIASGEAIGLIGLNGPASRPPSSTCWAFCARKPAKLL